MYPTLIRKGWWIFLLVFLGLSVWAGLKLPDFGVEAGTDVLLNEDDDDLAYYNETRADWGSDEYIIVCCHRNEGFFTPASLKLLNDLIERIKWLPHVHHITAITNMPLLRNLPPNAFGPTPIKIIDAKGEIDPKLDMDKAKREILEHTQAVGNLISPDGKDASAIVYLNVNEDINRYEPVRNKLLARKDPEAKKLLAEVDPKYQTAKIELNRRRQMLVNGVREIAKEWSPKFDEPLRLSGLSFINILLKEHIQSDILVFGVLSGAFFTLMYLVFYRRPRWVLLPIVTCALPVVIMLALMVVTNKKVTVVTSNMPVLLFVLMLPYSVYFIERYAERRSNDPTEDGKVSTTRAPMEIWIPCLYSCVATMAGTVAHMPSGINPVRTFGLMMTIGMGIGLATIMLFLPSAVLPYPPVRLGTRGVTAGATGPLRLLERLVLGAPKAVVIVSLLILVVSVYGTSRITVETKFIDYFWSRSPIYQGLDYIDTRMGGTTPVEVYLKGKPGTFKTREGLMALDAVAKFFDKLPETGNVRSFKTLVDEVRRAGTGKEEPTIKTLIGFAPRKLTWACSACGREFVEAMKQGLPVEPRLDSERTAKCGACKAESRQRLAHVERDQVDDFCNWDFSVSRVQVRMKETSPTLNRNRILADLRAHLATLNDKELAGLEVRPTGIFLLYSNMLNTLIAATRETFILAVVAIFIMLCFLWRSPLLALLVLLPQVLPVFLVLGTMGFTHIALDMVTVVIASVAMGVGIDAAIQYTVRFKAELVAVNGDIEQAVRRSHATIGRAILIATSIVFAGFAMLMFSNFVPTFYFGLFTGLAILMGLFASLTTLPSLFVLLNYPKLKSAVPPAAPPAEPPPVEPSPPPPPAA